MAAATNIVFFPVLGTGHFISMIEAAKRLLRRSSPGTLSATVLLMHPPPSGFEPGITACIDAAPSDITFVRLPPLDVSFDGIPVQQFLPRCLDLHRPVVASAIAALPSPAGALVVDMLATALLDVGKELALPVYVYFTSSAALLSLMLRLPEITADGEFVEIPGLPPVPTAAMPLPLSDKTNPALIWFTSHGIRYKEASGIIVNTAAELEGTVIAEMAAAAPPVYPIGPVVATARKEEKKHECIEWLDKQPPASVVVLCFGSMGGFSAPQLEEMAAGVERSGHRFLWCLRAPAATALPEGFLERTEGRGMVWPEWLPQEEVLAHPSAGGFVTHCGWNSVLESLWHGVAMAAWPLRAEQHLNAFQMAGAMGIAVEVPGGPVVPAVEVEKAVRSMMGETEEGRRVRAKAAATRTALRKAVEEGGSSDLALTRLIDDLVSACSGE